MKFACESGSLQKAIALVEKAISNRTPLAVMENIFFELKGSELILRGNDLEVGIEYKIPVQDASGDSSVLIKASTVSSIVSKMANQRLEFECDSNQLVHIKSEHVGFDIHGSSVDDYPVFPSVETGVTLTLKAEELLRFISHTVFAVSHDETKQFLNGLLVSKSGQDLHFVSTDGFRLALFQNALSEQVPDFSAIVPYKAMNELQKILQQMDGQSDVKMTVSEKQSSFVMTDFVLVSRLIQGQFPDYRQVLPKNSGNVFTVPRRTLVSAADRAQIIAAHSNNVVRFLFSQDSVSIRAVAPKMGEFNESIAVNRQSGDGDVKISFNVKLVLEAIKNIETDDIIVEFNNELSPCLMRPVTEEGYLYIVMPIRTSEYDVDSQSVSAAPAPAVEAPSAPVVASGSAPEVSDSVEESSETAAEDDVTVTA